MSYPATPKQVDYVIDLGKTGRQLVNELPEESDLKVGYTILLNELGRKVRDGISKSEASAFIDALKDVIANCRKELPRSAQPRSDRPEPEAGMYRQSDGTIVRVYFGQKSGRMLLKRVIGDREHGYDYEYVGAAAYKLGDAEPLTLEEAKAWGKMTGHCCVCARRLDNPESVEAGIGPVCAGRIDA